MNRRRTTRGRGTREDTSGRDRWLVSYADFITLLFAFFVVMYATSSVNQGKYRVLSDSLFSAFRHDRAAPSVAPVVDNIVAPPPGLRTMARTTSGGMPVPSPQREQKLRGLAVKISDALRALVQSGQVRLAQTQFGLAVEINASVLFAPAQAVLQPDSIVALDAVARVLAGVDNAIEVQGHSDNIPIATPQYPSNWELASARASSVVRVFIDAGVAPARLSATGFADNRPVESNDTVDGRARNRRVTILIRAEESPRAESTVTTRAADTGVPAAPGTSPASADPTPASPGATPSSAAVAQGSSGVPGSPAVAAPVDASPPAAAPVPTSPGVQPTRATQASNDTAANAQADIRGVAPSAR